MQWKRSKLHFLFFFHVMPSGQVWTNANRTAIFHSHNSFFVSFLNTFSAVYSHFRHNIHILKASDIPMFYFLLLYFSDFIPSATFFFISNIIFTFLKWNIFRFLWFHITHFHFLKTSNLQLFSRCWLFYFLSFLLTISISISS